MEKYYKKLLRKMRTPTEKAIEKYWNDYYKETHKDDPNTQIVSYFKPKQTLSKKYMSTIISYDPVAMGKKRKAMRGE